MAGGTTSAGRGAVLRLDPASLPIRYRVDDHRADGQERMIDLFPERVVVRRQVRGLAMKVQVPVEAYRGVGLRMIATEAGEQLAVMLEHDDSDLSVPLYLCAEDDADVIAHWQGWGKALAAPLLIERADGSSEPREQKMGALLVRATVERRRRRSVLSGRRSARRLRRACGHSRPTPVWRGVEMLARAVED